MAPKRAKAAAPAPEPVEDYSTWSAAKLKESLKELGASTGGSKDILAERMKTLKAATAASSAPPKREAASAASSEPPAKRGKAKAAPPEPEPKAAAKRSAPAKAAAPEPEPKAAVGRAAKAKAAAPEPEPKAAAGRAAKAAAPEPEPKAAAGRAAATKAAAKASPKRSSVAAKATADDIPIDEQHEFLDQCREYEWEEVKRLVEANPEIVGVQPLGREDKIKRWSALHQAAESGDVEMVRFLLGHNAPVDATNKDGKTPLDVAKKDAIKSILRDAKTGGAKRQAEPKATPKAEPKGKKRDPEGQTKEEPAAPAKLTAPSKVYFEDGEFKVDYAKSDKSSCNKCTSKIAKGGLRVGKVVQSDKFDGKYPMWHHASCFFTAGLLPTNMEMISGVSMLQTADQEEIKKHVPSGSTSSSSGGAKAQKQMEDQNKQIFDVQEMLSELADPQLKEMLALNGYPIVKLGVALKDVCADGIVFGASGHCDACEDSERNIFLLRGDSYACRGWVDEFLKCSNRTQKPERSKWQLTEAAKQVADGKLAKMKLTTGTRLFAKPITDGPPATSSASTGGGSPKPALLGQVVVLSNVLDSAVREGLAKLVTENGGMLADIVTWATTFVVSQATDQEEGDEGEEKTKAKELRVPGVAKAFLEESVEKGELQDMESHLLWGERRQRIEEKTTSHFKEKRGVKTDTDVGDLLDTAHVLVDTTARVVYSEMLTKTDVDSGANSFYTLHLMESDELQSDGNHHYHVFRKWGRIGSTQGGTKIEKFESNKDKAIKAFSSQYADKTGNSFGHKPDDFENMHGKMHRVSLEHKALCKGGANSSGDAGAAEDGNNDQPLGKLSKDQILKGDAVLDKIEALLQEGEGANAALTANKLKSLTNQFYSMIPHNFGGQKGPVLNNEELMGAEKAMLQFYLRMGFEEVGEPDEKLTPIGGVMELELPKSLAIASKGICPPGPVKQCTTKGAQMCKSKAGKPLQEMGPDLYGAILLYTSNAIYKQLNKALRDEDRKVVEGYFPYLRMLFEACARLETKKKTLWRGIGVDLFSTYKVGSTVVWWGVSSCTSNQKVARDFMAGCGDGATFLTIETTTACDIAEVSFYANEAESLLLPGTQLEVMKSERKGKQSEIWLREVGRMVG